MRRLTAIAAVAAMLAACGSGGGKAGLALHIETNPFRVTLVENGKTLVAEDKDARLRYQLAGSGEQHTLTKVVKSFGNGVYKVATDEPGRFASVSVQQTSTGAHLNVQLHPLTGVQQVYDAFDASSHDHFLGGGERSGPDDRVDLRGQILSVKVSDVCSHEPVPFFASSAGWGLWLDTRNVAALAFPGSTGGSGCQFGSEPQCAFPQLPDRVEVCVRGSGLAEDVYAGDFAQTLAAYQRQSGEPRVPPPAELALIKWRDVYDNSAQVLEDITRLRAASVPLGWVLVDNPWESCVGTLRFDPRRFPDPAGLIRQVHALGLGFMLWISPMTQCDVGYTKSQLLGDPAKQLVIDLRQRAVSKEFERRLAALVHLGVDGFKADRGDEVDLEGEGPILQNDYPGLYATHVMHVLGRSGVAIFRVGESHVVPGIWAGDQEGTWDGFQQAIRAGETAGASGFPTWGSDVGGYHSQTLTGDLFARWAQLGAISPVMEVGGQGANATPWTMGADAMTALREAAVLHYELVPMFEQLLRAHQPILRPLGFGYPDDEQAWQADLELLVGPDLLAAPVAGQGTTPRVYLPAGLWVDLHTGQTVKGPLAFTRPTPLDELPLYARAGAVIPFNLRTADSWWGVDELSHRGRAGYLVSDGSGLDLHGQPHDVQLWVPAAARPSGVTLGGHSVSWRWNPVPLPGVVIRVHGPTVSGEIVLHGH
jgi:alpha-D-xyloside xylohydrolase